MRQELGWKEILEDGTKRDVVASRNRNIWTFRYRDGRKDDWHEIAKPTVEQIEQLLDQLERKYQRRRCAWRDVEQVQELLAKAR